MVILEKKEQPSQGDDASTAEVVPGIFGRGEQGSGTTSEQRTGWSTTSRARSFTAQTLV